MTISYRRPLGLPATRQRRRESSPIRLAFICCLLLVLGSFAFLLPSAGPGLQTQQKATIQYTAHDPIIIYSESDLRNSSGVTGGSGTAEDPYIISGWDISTENIGACIFVFRTTSYYVIRDCHIHCPNAVCIELQESPHGAIVNCTIDEGMYGIFVSKSSYTNVTGNTVRNMTDLAIYAGSSNWVNVTSNVARDNDNWAFSCGRLTNATLENNIAYGNDRSGFSIRNATNLCVIGNNASANAADGFTIDDARNFEVQGNNISSNAGCGLRVSNATDGMIYHNRFVGNGLQAHEENSTSVAWDSGYPNGGNYWSDYSGADAFSGPDQDVPGADGIGDTPHPISGSAVDRYPFMIDIFQVPEFVDVVVPVIAVATIAGVCTRRIGRQGFR